MIKDYVSHLLFGRLYLRRCYSHDTAKLGRTWFRGRVRRTSRRQHTVILSKTNHWISLECHNRSGFFNLKFSSNYGGLNAQILIECLLPLSKSALLNPASVMTHYSIPSLPLCSGSSWSSISALNSLPQNCLKSPNFEISEGVPIKKRFQNDNYGSLLWWEQCVFKETNNSKRKHIKSRAPAHIFYANISS